MGGEPRGLSAKCADGFSVPVSKDISLSDLGMNRIYISNLYLPKANYQECYTSCKTVSLYGEPVPRHCSLHAVCVNGVFYVTRSNVSLSKSTEQLSFLKLAGI